MRIAATAVIGALALASVASQPASAQSAADKSDARCILVLQLVARGFSTREIADELVISRKTVGNHVEHIYTKIGVSNRALACLFASRNGLMSGVQANSI